MPAASPMSFVATPEPSPGISEKSSPAPSSSAALRKKEGLGIYFKRVEKRIDLIQDDIKNTSERFISIEEEKKEILKSYVEKEAEVQNALIDFLKRQ